MHAGSRVQNAGFGCGQRRRPGVAVITAASDDDACDARGCGALQDLFAIFIETVMRKIGTDVDEKIVHQNTAP